MYYRKKSDSLTTAELCIFKNISAKMIQPRFIKERARRGKRHLRHSLGKIHQQTIDFVDAVLLFY